MRNGKKHYQIIFLLPVLLLAGLAWFYYEPQFSSQFSSEVKNFTPEQAAKAEWSVSPVDFANSNPLGRSYFDYVFSKKEGDRRVYDIPYPFQNALEKIRQYLGYENSGVDPVLVALFPMGRSLQRNAAFTNESKQDLNLFFKYPRVVSGVGQEPLRPQVLNLKGRLYMGFHEKSQIIEVISYNDDEGRYEYQVVRDYKSGANPKVFYANRALCLSCHQNQTPIFSRPPWDESNANPTVAKLLHNHHSESYFGAPLDIDLGVPYSLDNLTDDGNLFHLYQKVWLSLCADAACQTETLRSIFYYVLSSREGVFGAEAHAAYLQKMSQDYKARFPNGLKIPSPDIPNRDPLTETDDSPKVTLDKIPVKVKGTIQELVSKSTVPGEFEPLQPRDPTSIIDSWDIDKARNANKLILGLSDFFGFQDVKWLDGWLIKENKKVAAQIQMPCAVSTLEGGVSIKCETADAYFEGSASIVNDQVQEGSVTLLKLLKVTACNPKAIQTTANRTSGVACPALFDIALKGAVIDGKFHFTFWNKSGLSARFINGLRINKAVLDPKTKNLSLSLVNDFDWVDGIINTWKAARVPFSRKRVVHHFAKEMGIKIEDPDVEGKMATLEKNVEDDQSISADVIKSIQSPLHAFTVSCSMCHYNTENVPPAFLGLKQESLPSSLDKCKRIEVCAPRMLYRVKMRNCSPSKIAESKKTPMPIPAFFTRTKIDSKEWQSLVANTHITKFLAEILDRPGLTKELIQKGITSDQAAHIVQQLAEVSCPDVDYKEYEALPPCQFTTLANPSRCDSLLKTFGNE